nr:synaptobrevin, longin-like domain protein [Tanacetum cinerariifolium]
MVSILEKSKHNIDFHPMVDFVKASPLRRNLKLQDEEGISSLRDTKLFENLTLMGYNISPNQKFTFQKGQFSHQWKFLIHTIMQCLSPKSTGFNEFSSNISTALVCLATNRTYNFSKMIFDGLVKNGEGSGTPTEPHHTPSQEAQPSSHTHISSPSIPTVIPSDTTPIRQYTRRARIAQSSALPPIADEPASPVRDVIQGEACPTDSGFIADQIGQPLLSPPPCPMIQHQGLLPLLLKRADKKGVIVDRSEDDAPIKGRRIDEEEVATERLSSDTEEVRLDEGDVAAERASEDTKEMATVLTTMDAATVLASGAAKVPTGSGSIPTAGPPADEVPTGSDVVPTASLVFNTATVVTPYRRRKGKEVMRRAKQIARDAEIARIHAEEELQSMIDGLDNNNETVAKYLEEYRQFSSELLMERRIELISDLVKYQDNYTKVKDFKGMTFEEVETKFNSVCKQMEDFIPMGSKEEAEKIKRKGINLEQESEKKQKSSEEITEEVKSSDEVFEEKIKELIQLVPIEEVYVKALQVKHPIID